MSILSGSEIIKQVKSDRIKITDFDEKRINPNSYNLTLSNRLLVYNIDKVIDIKGTLPSTNEILIGEKGYVLEPGKLYLACTNESTYTDYYVPMIEGRSSFGRIGMFIHITAGFGDISFSGKWTLEIIPTYPTKIYPGVEICQIYYETIEGDTDIKYNGKYNNNTGVQSSKITKDFIK